jgi:hypothetical protein
MRDDLRCKMRAHNDKASKSLWGRVWPKGSDAAVGLLLDEVDALRALAADFVSRNPNPCLIDHNGDCQEHNWFRDEVCPWQRAKQMGIR